MDKRHQINLRLREGELELLKRKAEEQRLSTTDLIRQRRVLPLDRQPAARDEHLLRHLERRAARRETEPGLAALEGLRAWGNSHSGAFEVRLDQRLDGVIPAQLNVVTLGTRDLARMRSFYAALGWDMAIEAEDFCAFRLRGALLALFPSDKLAADGQAAAAPPARGMRGFSLGINVDRPEHVDEIVAAAEIAGATVTKPPSNPTEFEGRHAYFAGPRGELLGGRLPEGRGHRIRVAARRNGPTSTALKQRLLQYLCSYGRCGSQPCSELKSQSDPRTVLATAFCDRCVPKPRRGAPSRTTASSTSSTSSATTCARSGRQPHHQRLQGWRGASSASSTARAST